MAFNTIFSFLTARVFYLIDNFILGFLKNLANPAFLSRRSIQSICPYRPFDNRNGWIILKISVCDLMNNRSDVIAILDHEFNAFQLSSFFFQLTLGSNNLKHYKDLIKLIIT